MTTYNIFAVSFFVGALTGIAIMTWVVFYPLPYWSDSRQFLNLPKRCIISDIGAQWQVYCPPSEQRVSVTS